MYVLRNKHVLELLLLQLDRSDLSQLNQHYQRNLKTYKLSLVINFLA